MKTGGLFGFEITNDDGSKVSDMLILYYDDGMKEWMRRVLNVTQQRAEALQKKPSLPLMYQQVPRDKILDLLLAQGLSIAYLHDDVTNDAAGYAHIIMSRNKALYGVLYFRTDGFMRFEEIVARDAIEARTKIISRLPNLGQYRRKVT